MSKREQLELTLKKELFSLASTLSPGVKLKMQIEFPSTELSRSQDSLIAPRAKVPETDARSLLRKRNAGNAKRITANDDDDIEEKKTEPWLVVYNLYERKKKQYHLQWENEVIAHSISSKQRLENYEKKQEKRRLELEQEKLKTVGSKKERSFFKRVPRPAIAPPPVQETETVKKEKPFTYKRVVVKRDVVSSKSRSETTPAFRQLSIDKTTMEAAEQWAKTLQATEKRLERTKQILFMSDTILKIKSVTHQTLQKSENAIEEDSQENLDFEESFAPEAQLAETSSVDLSHLSSPKMIELQTKIIENSRRANMLTHIPAQVTPSKIDRVDVIDQREKVRKGSAVALTKKHEIPGNLADIGLRAQEPVSTSEKDAARGRHPPLLAHIQYKSDKSVNGKEGILRKPTTIVPLIMTDLLNDSTVKITVAHAPLSSWIPSI